MKIEDMVQRVREEAREYFKDKPAIRSKEDVEEYLEAAMWHPGKEEFGALLLDNRHNVLEFKVLFEGTVDQSAVYPREVAKHALLLDAAAVLVCHNHPGGGLMPSKEDIEITKKIKEGLDTLDIRFLDHVIITKMGESVSLKEQGYV